MCNGKSTHEYLHDLRQELFLRTAEWQTKIFGLSVFSKVDFSTTGNTTKIKAILNGEEIDG